MADDKVIMMAPVSKEKMSPPPLPAVPVLVPVDDDVIKQLKPLLAVLVDVEKAAPPASPPSSVAVVMPADNNNNNNNKTPTRPPVVDVDAASILLMVVCVWALFNAVVYAACDIATLIVNRNPCTKSTWLFRCVALTKAAAAEATILLYGELVCSAAAALAAPLHMLLTTTTRSCRWAAVDALLAWVALAATAGMHCLELVSDHIFLAADPGATVIFVDAVFGSVCLAADLLAAVLLCCSPRRHLDHQDDHGEVV